MISIPAGARVLLAIRPVDCKRCAVALSPSGVWLWLAAPGHEFVDPILRPAVDEAR